MTNKKLKFGVIGVGRIGKIHIENLVNQISGAEVIAASDVFAAELKKVTKQFNIPNAFSDYKDILNRSDVDAIVVCSPTDTHYRILLDAAAAKKHIFCEKPIDLSLEKIRDINDAVEKSGVNFMVGFNRRFDPNFSKVHEVINTGKIGDPHILRITSRDPSPPPAEYIKASGGIFLDMTIHDFDMARFLIDSKITEVYAKGAVLVDEVFEEAGDWDTAIIMLTYANGAMAAIDNSRQAVYGYDQRVEVFGSKGMVTVKNNTPDNHIHIDTTGMHSPLPLNFFMDRYTESYLNEMQVFIDCLKNNTQPPVSGKDGLLAVVVGLAAMKSVREHRPVKISEIF